MRDSTTSLCGPCWASCAVARNMKSPVVSFAITEAGKRYEARDFIVVDDLRRNGRGEWHCAVQHRVGKMTIIVDVLIACDASAPDLP